MPLSDAKLAGSQGASSAIDAGGSGVLVLGVLPILAGLRTIRAARDFVRWTLGRSETAPGLVDDATLIVSELLTNVAVHCSQGAAPDAVVKLIRAGAWLRIEVHDASPLVLAQRAPSLDAENGRGLLVVDALAERWGYASTADGKCVWCELPAWPEQTTSQRA